jgi:hypothetical protein
VIRRQPAGCLAALFGGAAGSSIETDEAVPDAPLPYCRKDFLLTEGERAFFGVLQTAVAERYLICLMVRMADLLFVQKGSQGWRHYFNKISAKHIDFVLCDRNTVRPLLAIELDDASHNRSNRRKRDNFVDSACEAAGLPILRVPARATYNAEDLARSINAAI